MMKKAKHTGELAALAAGLPQRIEDMEAQMSELAAQMAVLKDAGLIYATEHWRKDVNDEPKYFYLLYPKQPDSPRRRDYIGSDVEKIEEARAGMRRAKDFDKLAEKLANLNNYVYRAIQALRDATSYLGR